MEAAGSAGLRLKTWLVTRALSGGEVLCAPLADRTIVSVGDEEDALLEQKLGLPEHLATLPAEAVARHSFPEGTHLRAPDVVLPRTELPRKLQVKTPIALSAAVIPASRTVSRPREDEVRVKYEGWLFLLPLGAVAHVSVDERFTVPTPKAPPNVDELIDREASRRIDAAVDARIAEEAVRLWTARDADPYGWLSLLPSSRDELVPMELELHLAEGALNAAQRAQTLKKALAEHEKRKRAVEILDSIGQALHFERQPFSGDPQPLVGRDKERALLSSLLSATRDGDRGSAEGGTRLGDRQAVLLVGRERVGKTALLLSWIDAQLRDGRSPLVWSTSGAALVAGMSGLGQWQERVRRVMQAAADLDAVLAIDDLGDLFSERGRSTVDIPSAMRPFLEQGRVRLVAEAHEDRLDRMERANTGFFASLSKIRLAPLDAETTLAAVTQRAAWEARHAPDAPRFDDRALPAIVDLADRYLSYESFPGKAMRLFDEVRAAQTASGQRRIGEGAVFDAVSLRTGVPSFLLREERSLALGEVIERLSARVIGQPEAVRRVAETVCVVKAGLQPQGKPLATFLFVGPTGVGKTELARALADFLFGASGSADERIARFDMSEFMDPLAAERLIQGDDRGEGLLTRKVRQQPFCVLLLDEIEKAHPRVFDLLLQVAGEGRLTDAAGRTAYFHNAILILTSNLGAAQRRAAAGFSGEAAASDGAHYERAARETFRPEMLNRIDRIVAFHDLGPEHRRTLVRLAVDKVRRRRGLLEAGAELRVSEAALDRLGDDGYSAAYGARALRRHVEEHLVSGVGRLMSAFGDPSEVDVDVRLDGEPPAAHMAQDREGPLVFSLVRRGSVKGRRELSGMTAISNVRRELARVVRLDRFDELREQVRFLVAQLGHGSKKKKGTTFDGREHGRLQAEHHRLSELMVAIDRAIADVQAIEETALEAYLRGEKIGELLDEARRIEREAATPLVRALLANEPRRAQVAYLVQELDAGRALDVFLRELLDVAETKGWVVRAHVDRGARDDVASWPKDRRFGPPRDARALEALLTERERAPLNLLVTIEGEYAISAAFEGGLQRFVGLGGKVDPAHLLVQLVALRTSFSDDEWKTKLEPEPQAAYPERVRLPPVRVHDRSRNVVTVTVPGSGLPATELESEHYFRAHDQVVLAVLLACERGAKDRSDLLTGRLGGEEDELRAILQSEGKIAAIKRYRELTGAGLAEAKQAIDRLDEPPESDS